MQLREIQRYFMRALYSNDETLITPFLTDVGGLEVHKNNIHVSCWTTLQDIYPVIQRLVGGKFFRYAAEQYIENHPSTNGDLNCYGSRFADFLSRFDPTAHLVYLPDVARLEWCCHIAYLAGDDAPFDMQKLEIIPSERYVDLQFQVNQSSSLLNSEWPIDKIWHVNQPDYNGDQTVDLNSGGVNVLIQRSGINVMIFPLDVIEWTFLKSLHEGASLGNALAITQDVASHVDLEALMKKFISMESLVDLSH